jgi:hypothetical protein
MYPSSLDDDFFDGRRSARMPFIVNDPVEITLGEYRGRPGSIVLLDRSHTEWWFLVEFGDGKDELVAGSLLALLDSQPRSCQRL